MSRNLRFFLEDIKESCEFIIKYTKELTYDEFKADRRTTNEVVRELEIIGEAIKHIPNRIKDEHSEINWRDITALRNVLVHFYFGINISLIWTTVQNEVRPLLANN
ncbi:MAG: DUF86 domain-containing protein [Calditrichota bacterium]